MRGTAASRFSSSSSSLHQGRGTAVPQPVHNAPYLIDNLYASSYALLWRCAFIWGVSSWEGILSSKKWIALDALEWERGKIFEKVENSKFDDEHLDIFFLIYILVDYRLWLNLFQTSLLLSFYFIFFLFKRPFITCISHLISILTMYNESIIERVPEDSLIKWWVIKTHGEIQ